jgi:hypothetical protein
MGVYVSPCVCNWFLKKKKKKNTGRSQKGKKNPKVVPHRPSKKLVNPFESQSHLVFRLLLGFQPRVTFWKTLKLIWLLVVKIFLFGLTKVHDTLVLI